MEIRWSCAPALLTEKSEAQPRAVFHFPGGLSAYLGETLAGEVLVGKEVFAGKSAKQGGHGSVEWAIAWFAGDGFVRSYCNTVPTPEGGTHEAGLRSALLRGFKSYAELVGNKRAAVITSDDIMTSCGAMLSVFIREPEFVGQTKDRLASAEALRVVDNAVRDAFDHWLAASPNQATQLLDWMIERADERMRRRRDKEISRKTATRKLRLPGKLADCSSATRARYRALHRRGRFRRRVRQAGARPPHPGDPAAARQDPQRRRRGTREARRRTSSSPISSRRSVAIPARATARTICATARS